MKSDHINFDRIKTDRIKSITDPSGLLRSSNLSNEIKKGYQNLVRLSL
jgi:hypothetical protein